MWNVLTLDGFVCGRSEAADRQPQAWGEELLRLALPPSKLPDALLLGRIAYEAMSGYWSSATGEAADFMNATPKVVFSRRLRSAGWRNTRLVTASPASEVASMKRQAGRELWVLGGGALSDLLVQHGLIDEWRLGVSPIVLCEGEPPCRPSARRSTVQLLETQRLASGCLILRYGRQGRQAKSRPLPAAASLQADVDWLAASGAATSMVDGPFAETKEWALASRRSPAGVRFEQPPTTRRTRRTRLRRRWSVSISAKAARQAGSD